MRGGRRPGAGRPAKENKRVQLSISVAPETRDWLRDQSAEQGVTIGRIVEVCIESFKEECKESQQ
jgi:hypothetical protein